MIRLREQNERKREQDDGQKKNMTNEGRIEALLRPTDANTTRAILKSDN